MTLKCNVELLHQIMMTSAKRRDVPAAVQKLEELRSILAVSPAVNTSASGRFALASAINSLVSLGLRTAAEPRFRTRISILNWRLPINDSPSPTNSRLKREAEANAEALEILQTLTADDASSVAYRVALAQATKDKARIAQHLRDWPQVDEAMAAAIQILETLQKEYPASDRFRYELADTLSSMPVSRPADMQRLLRAQQLCRELMDEHPSVPEYRSLYASTLARMAGMLMAQGKTERAEATLEETLKSYKQLAGQFPDVLMYHLALARTQQQLAQIYADSQRTEQAKVTLDAAIGRLENLSIPGRIRNPIAMLTNRLRESRKNPGP